ncbi:cytochrome c-type biogenesis protein CcmH [Rhizobium lemnae]|nr:cytochrome c-type biogenesis protein [Rhizobium lemnae]MCJ8507604.1 cytochrome c-type biogenesis protein CcmH [Rhizobium lemnae]
MWGRWPAGQRGLFALLILLLLAPLPAYAVNPDEVLKDPKLEQRARDLSAQLRCMVCQNQSIDDSNAELAKDLRVLVRERITAGDSDEQVINYLVSRYGEFVLLKPRLSAQTIALWATPVVLFIIGGVAVYRLSRRSRPATGAEKALTAEEQARLAELLRKEEG